MCLPLVGRVAATDGDFAAVELLGGDGGEVRVGLALYPDVTAGAHVLIDRGLIIEVVDAAQAETLLAFYAEFAETVDLVEAGDD